jgi:hypothetical protein
MEEPTLRVLNQEDMVERVARAVYGKLAEDSFVGEYGAHTRTCAGVRLDGEFDLHAVARAAIEAMRWSV